MLNFWSDTGFICVDREHILPFCLERYEKRIMIHKQYVYETKQPRNGLGRNTYLVHREHLSVFHTVWLHQLLTWLDSRISILWVASKLVFYFQHRIRSSARLCHRLIVLMTLAICPRNCGHDGRIGLEGASREDLPPLRKLEVLGGTWANWRSELLLAKHMFSTRSESCWCWGPRFHTVCVVGLLDLHALSRAVSFDCSSTNTRLQRVDLCILLCSQLLTERYSSASSLVLVAVEGKRVLPVDFTVSKFPWFLKIMMNRKVTKDGLRSMLGGSCTKMCLWWSIPRAELRFYHLLVVRVIDCRILSRNCLVFHGTNPHALTQGRRRRLCLLVVLWKRLYVSLRFLV